MLENISKVMNNGNKKKMIVLITGVVVLALVLCIGAIFWSVQHNARVKEARKACEVQVAQVTKANKSWNKLIKNSLLVSFAKEDSENGKLLNKLMKLRIPETVVCNANSPEALGAQNAQAIAAAQWYSDNAQRIRSITSIMIDKAAGDESTQEDKKKEEESQKQLQELTAPVIRKAPRVQRRPRLTIPNIPPDPVETAKKKAQEDAAAKEAIREAEKKKAEAAKKAAEKRAAEKRKEELEQMRKEIREAEKKAAEKKAEEEKKKKEEEEKKKKEQQTPPPVPSTPQTPSAPSAGGSGSGSGTPGTVNTGGATGGSTTTPQPPIPQTPASNTPAGNGGGTGNTNNGGNH
ncbi:hypothetical protein HXT36_02380 [Gardnerella sp. DNF01144]|uniref:ATPase n=1 Tax=Gardnerella piotii TaxID=2792977 RepID=A0ABU5MQH7_9BIFI|nr:hypothetical protein [Gardnerella piotii]MDZ7544677.1 hypothetical protein [Gardnerella piotii]MDZ7551959.1 hypothetical protein [Gardnerella piotii]